ncbi:hypothetical protein [Streptomyces sp. NPDC002758]
MTDRLTPQREAEIAARDLIATRGPWGMYEDATGRIDIAADLEETGHGYRCRRGIAQLDTEPIDNDPKHREWTEAEDNEQVRIDAEFIAHARTDVPALLAELAAVREERDAFCDRVDTLTAVAKGNKRHVQDMFLELQKAHAARDEAQKLTEAVPALVATVKEVRALRAPLTEALQLVYRSMVDCRPDEWAMEWLGEVWTRVPLNVRALAGDEDAAAELASEEATR